MSTSTASSPKIKLLMAVAAVGVVGLGTGAMLLPSEASTVVPEAEVTLEVPGAISVSAYCGGEETFMTKGRDATELTFSPDGVVCDIEAPLSPAMPLRGQLELTGAGHYRCVRHNVDLVCSAL